MTDDSHPMRRFVRPEKSASADPFLCRHLRTKNWLAPDAFGQGDPRQSPSTSQYWCLRTMRAAGPDGDFAVPEACTDERVCFEPATRRGGDS